MTTRSKRQTQIDGSSKVQPAEDENTMWPIDINPSQKRKNNEESPVEQPAKKPKTEFLWKLVKPKYLLTFRLCDGKKKIFILNSILF